MNTRQSKLSTREQQYLEHLRQAQARQLTLAQYCRAQGLSVRSLYNVSWTLARKGKLSHRARSVMAKRPEATDKFLAVRVTPVAAAAGAVCRLRHPNGWMIECASWPQAAWMSQLVNGDDHAAT